MNKKTSFQVVYTEIFEQLSKSQRFKPKEDLYLTLKTASKMSKNQSLPIEMKKQSKRSSINSIIKSKTARRSTSDFKRTGKIKIQFNCKFQHENPEKYLLAQKLIKKDNFATLPVISRLSQQKNQKQQHRKTIKATGLNFKASSASTKKFHKNTNPIITENYLKGWDNGMKDDEDLLLYSLSND